MKTQELGYFFNWLHNRVGDHYPGDGHVELTYRCNFNCVHCYCKGLEDKGKELTTEEWKKILDEIHKEGCLWLTFSGGEPLARKDFLEIYAYAKRKGFIITLFTNGYALSEETINYLIKFPPLSIEITLNGITENTYETITQVKGSFSKIMEAVRKLAKTDLRVILKANCLKQNKDEIGRIKAFTEEVFGKPAKKRYRFKYDPMIYPRFNRDREPCNHRLSFEELLEAKKQDADIWKEYQQGLHCDFPDLERGKSYLYRCNTWMKQFFITPYGKLKFCIFSEKFSVDLRKASFREGFYRVFPRVLKERFKTNSKCRDCSLRPICYHCPARAYLETGDEESPVEYYCQLARETAKQMQEVHENPALP